MKVGEFRGEDRAGAPSKIEPVQFQVDQGGDRFLKKAWRRRRGMRHTDIAQQVDPVTGLLGIELPGGEFATLVVEGNNVHGFEGVAEE